MPIENASLPLPLTNGSDRHQLNGSSTSALLKRRGSERFVGVSLGRAMDSLIIEFRIHSIYDHQATTQEWTDYMLQSKRPHLMMSANSHLFSGHPPMFEYQSSQPHMELFTNALDKVS